MDYTGQTLDGRYRVLSLLGSGGMGSVWLGRHAVIGKKVAVKFLKAEFVENEEAVKRFYREAQAAAAIGHGNIIDIFDVGVSSTGEPYLVMEYLEGESLDAMLKRTGPLNLPAALAVMEPTLSALEAAHDKGIVHRDLKPENIFIAHVPGRPPLVKLIDFGISKFTPKTGASRLTKTGLLLGTPFYMSPEQVRGDSTLDHRSDLYAMGVILYEMLTGKLPFNGDHYNAIIINVLTENPIPPEEAFAGFPSEAEPLLMRLLSKSPSQRHQNASELLSEIKKLAGFGARDESLSRYTTGIQKRRCAVGDLGEESSESGRNAAEILAEMSVKPTPADWSRTVSPKKKRFRKIVVASVVGFAAAAAVVVIFFIPGKGALHSDTSGPVPALAPTAAPAAAPVTKEVPVPLAPPENVGITLSELPPGATVYVDDRLMSGNPLALPRSDKPSTMRITAPGYIDFVGPVTPMADSNIRAALVPLPQASEPEKTEKKSASVKPFQNAKKQPASAPKPASEKPKGGIVDIGGGIKGRRSFGD